MSVCKALAELDMRADLSAFIVTANKYLKNSSVLFVGMGYHIYWKCQLLYWTLFENSYSVQVHKCFTYKQRYFLNLINLIIKTNCVCTSLHNSQNNINKIF